MIIYIASSWRNQHAVEMLTESLEARGHEVKSFVRESTPEYLMPGRTWLDSAEAQDKFRYDSHWATHADLVIYIGPSGTDAWAEVGAAWAMGVPLLGLWAKGEPAGLMRHMVLEWHHNYRGLLDSVGAMTAVA